MRRALVSVTVMRISAGALNHVKVARVVNINHAIDTLKDEGFWVYGAEVGGQRLYDANLTGKICLVIGGEGNKERIHKVYWEFFALKFFIAGLLAFGFWHLTEPFLVCWLGEQYLLTKLLLLLLIINEFIWQIRYTTDAFIMGYGLFQDVWAPVVESIISVVVAVLGGYFWGLEGVLLGTIVSMSLIVCIWKPYFLFKEGLKISVWGYWTNFVRYSISLLCAVSGGRGVYF